jgi:two-component system, NtrC family, nitrogen regulation sensor histidine kinase NtrY
MRTSFSQWAQSALGSAPVKRIGRTGHRLGRLPAELTVRLAEFRANAKPKRPEPEAAPQFGEGVEGKVYGTAAGREFSRKSNPWLFRSGLVLVILSIIAGLTTYAVLTGLTSIRPTHEVVVTMLRLNGVLIAAMVAIVAWQIFGLWRARRRQAAGAGLHVRIVGLFSVVALFPAILLAVFASVSLDRGLDQWFSARTKAIIKDSVEVANAYLNEHGKIIRTDLVGMARELEAGAQLLQENREGFQRYAGALAAERRIPFAFLVDNTGQPVLEAMRSANYTYVPPPPDAIALANEGRVVDIGMNGPGAVGALKKLNDFENMYLYVLRPVDPTVIGHLRRTAANVADYGKLLQQRTGVQVAFAMMFVVIALTLLVSAIWVGLWFANDLVSPIRRLIGAAQDVSRGNLAVAVEVENPRGDIGQLGSTFNRMTSELRNQRDALVGANTKLDERRRFMEAVLSGVTAGVIGVDGQGIITLVNRSAVDLIGLEEEALIGKPLAEALPQFAAVVAKAPAQSRKPVQSQIAYRRDSSELTLSVRVTREGAGKRNDGFVVTFDDITELVVAQRTSAWADVAQRIAHEIKNPLTPIQLSAERIRRKYASHITVDREIFDRCTDTIVRHVGDIGRMVDEFSSFARMPKPVFEKNDVGDIVREAVILFQMSVSDIEYVIDVPQKPLVVDCDRRLLTQGVTNLVKNAGEAIGAARSSDKKGEGYIGRIVARVQQQGTRCVIEVVDNGCGLPTENRHRLTEPYVTTRQKGTGLGLAIVQRIAEQHGGKIELDDARDEKGEVSGAVVRVTVPLDRAADEPEVTEVEERRQAGPLDSEAKHRLVGDNEGVSYGV